MTRDQQLEAIRSACIKANPDIFTGWPEVTLEGKIIGRPIRLADVLLAIPRTVYIKKLRDMARLVSDELGEIDGPDYWNLRQDDLTQQSDECITFLADLLA